MLNPSLKVNSILPENMTEFYRERQFFSEVPKNMIRQLYDLYRGDFEMFTYNKLDGYLALSKVGD